MMLMVVSDEGQLQACDFDKWPLTAHSCLCASHREAATVAPILPLDKVGSDG